ADAGATVRVLVSASNVAGSTSALSAPTAVVQAAPGSTTAPTITGTAQTGKTLDPDTGAWAGRQPIGFGYQWRRCDAGGGGCTDLVPCTGQTYTLTSADAGATVLVLVTASNVAGSASAPSAATAVVQAAPQNTALPTVTGTAQTGKTLSADPGAWSGTQPIGFAYQWRRCDAGGGGCVDVAGATSASYLLVAADAGATVRVLVTASNVAGSASALSAPTAAVQAAPQNTALPTVTGTAQASRT